LKALEAELARIAAENEKARKSLGGLATGLGDVADATKKALTPMQQFQESAANMVSGTLNQLLDIAFVFDGMADNISRATSAVGELMRELVKLAAKKALMALVNNLALGGPGIVSSVAGGIKKLIGFAHGGIISEPTAMVGLRSGNLGMMAERGPEAIVPLGGRGGAMTLTVNVYGSVGVEDIGEQLVNHLRTKGI
jgi:phage-related minor tail protein